MQKVKPIVHGVSESLFITLWMRAKFVRDPIAKRIIDAIDYDFSKFEKWEKLIDFTITRTDIFDREVLSFIKRYPNTIVVNIGAGLDTRFFRVDNGSICWYELDFRDVIELRKRLFKETERYHFIASPAENPQWISEVTQTGRPVLFIAEGVLMYLNEKEVKQFFTLILTHFPNADILFEIIRPLWTKLRNPLFGVTSEQPTMKWGISDVRQLERWDRRFHILAVYENSDSLLSSLLSKVLGNAIVHVKVLQ